MVHCHTSRAIGAGGSAIERRAPPMDITRRRSARATLKEAFRGYHRDDVDMLLERAAATIEHLTDELAAPRAVTRHPGRPQRRRDHPPHAPPRAAGRRRRRSPKRRAGACAARGVGVEAPRRSRAEAEANGRRIHDERDPTPRGRDRRAPRAARPHRRPMPTRSRRTQPTTASASTPRSRPTSPRSTCRSTRRARRPDLRDVDPSELRRARRRTRRRFPLTQASTTSR